MKEFAVACFAKDPILARLPIAAYACLLRVKVRPQSFSQLLRRRRRKSDGLRPKFFVAQIAVSLRSPLPCQDGTSES